MSVFFTLHAKLSYVSLTVFVDKTDQQFLDKPGPNSSTIVTACKLIVYYEHFKWSAKDGFSFARHDSVRFQSWLDGAVREKRLTRGRWQKQTWIGFATLSRMVRAYLERAIPSGTINWDLTIARCFSSVPVASLGVRAGDLAQSGGYDGEEYIKYEDVELFIDGDEAVFTNLRVQITVKYAKGKKDEHNEDDVHFLRPLNGPHNCHVCPIALLLVHSLRHSLVNGKTLQDVLNHAADRSDRRIEWLYPNRPILAAFESYRCELDKPASTGQLSHSIKHMGLAAGMFDRAYVHALRLGAARDVAHLPSAMFDRSGLTSEVVRQTLHHSETSFKTGVTESYVGGLSAEVYNARAKNMDAVHGREPRFASLEGNHPYDLVHAPVSEQEIEAASADSLARTGRVIPRKAAIAHVHERRLQSLTNHVNMQPRGGHGRSALPAPSPLPTSTTARAKARGALIDIDGNARPRVEHTESAESAKV